MATPISKVRRDIVPCDKSLVICRHPFCGGYGDGIPKLKTTEPAATATNCFPSTSKCHGRCLHSDVCVKVPQGFAALIEGHESAIGVAIEHKPARGRQHA